MTKEIDDTGTISMESITYILHNDQNIQHFIQFDPTIQAFCHHSNNRPKIGLNHAVYPASLQVNGSDKAWIFLSRDIQQQISTYNTKYRDAPTNDTSPQSTRKHILPAPATKLPEKKFKHKYYLTCQK